MSAADKQSVPNQSRVVPAYETDTSKWEGGIDDTLNASFPASDPPSWTLGVDANPRDKEKTSD